MTPLPARRAPMSWYPMQTPQGVWRAWLPMMALVLVLVLALVLVLVPVPTVLRAPRRLGRRRRRRCPTR